MGRHQKIRSPGTLNLKFLAGDTKYFWKMNPFKEKLLFVSFKENFYKIWLNTIFCMTLHMNSRL